MMELDVIARSNDPEKAALVHDAFVPAARAARADGVRVHLERHWRHGPHVALALSGEPATVTATAERARTAIADWVAAHPSRRVVPTDELVAAAERAGRLELVPGPYTPVWPDNAVFVAPPGRDHLARLMGGAEPVAVRADLLAAALDAVDHTTAHARSSSGRVLAALRAMVAHSCHYAPGPTGGAMSFLSHLEDFLHRSGSGPALRARFDEVWLGRADEVTALVGDVFADPARPRHEAIAVWDAWSTLALERSAAAYALGRIPLVPGDTYRDAAAELGLGGFDGADLSAFHQHVTGRFDPRAVAEHFGPYRFATNVLYQVLLVCDVTPVERCLAAHLLSRGVSRLTGVDWHERSARHEEHAS